MLLCYTSILYYYAILYPRHLGRYETVQVLSLRVMVASEKLVWGPTHFDEGSNRLPPASDRFITIRESWAPKGDPKRAI